MTFDEKNNCYIINPSHCKALSLPHHQNKANVLESKVS